LSKINYHFKYSTTAHVPHNTIPLGRFKYSCPVSSLFLARRGSFIKSCY